MSTRKNILWMLVLLLNMSILQSTQIQNKNQAAFLGKDNQITNVTDRLWPLPTKISLNTSSEDLQFEISDIAFKIEAVPSDYIQEILNYYIVKVFRNQRNLYDINKGSQIIMNIVVKNPWQIFANTTEHEKYQLTIRQNQKWELVADYYPGFVRGLQTFSQLLQRKENGKYVIKYRPVLIDDQPSFVWRGLMIDTSRHFLPVDQIKKIIDGLMYNKMNILHWHIIDQDSFPMQVTSRPQLSSYGKLSGSYSTANIKQLIEYAKARSIRIIPQYDTPAHTRSWGLSPNLKQIIVQGEQPYQGEFNPIIDLTYQVLNDVMKHVNSIFMDTYTHLGGDQIDDDVWDTKPEIKQWMKQHNMTEYDELEIYYRKKQREMLRAINPTRKAIYWANQQIDLPVDEADVIQWWGQTQNIQRIKPRKNQIILSNYDLAYLDVGFGDELGDPYRWHVSWRQIYEKFQPKIKDVNVIGGEGCIWSELTNKDNIEQKVWIRSCSLAQRLWNTNVSIKGNLLNIVRRLIAKEKECKKGGSKYRQLQWGCARRVPRYVLMNGSDDNLIYKYCVFYYTMTAKSTLILAAISIAIITGSLYLSSSDTTSRDSNLQSQIPANGLTVTFKTISSILRTSLHRVFTLNDTVYAGESVGSIGIWSFDAKKKKLQFQDISRQVAGQLPAQNKVVHLQAEAGGVAVLTADGKLTSYATNSASKIVGTSQIQVGENLSWFTLIKINSSSQNAEIPTIIAGINSQKSQLCLYQVKQSIGRPNPVTKLQCNQTLSSTVSYEHVAFDTMNNLISVGDENKVIVFQLNATGTVSLKYLVEANLPKVETKGFKSIFTNGTLLTINDLWLNSYSVDVAAPTLKVISAERTQKIIKSGLTTDISALFDPKLKKSMVIINSKDRTQAYTCANNKLTYVNDSKTIGRCESFMLRDQATLFAAYGSQLQALKIGDPNQKDYLAVQDSSPIGSANHFRAVKSISIWNNSVVTTSDGGKFNFKLWTYDQATFKLTLVDEKTITFFSLLKSGEISFLSTLMIPPPSKSSNANITLHIAAVGADPFSLYIVPVTTQGKLGSVFRSKDEHSGNVTTIMFSGDHKQIITGSMDSTIKVWTLTTNHDQVEDNTITITTKNGPIKVGAQDKTGTYFVFGHCSNNFNGLVNITLWKIDPKHGLVKLAQNVPGESHQSNLTALILTHDEKYFISLSESGQLRLWRHEGWTMVDLMASLGLGIFGATIQTTQTNKLLIESQKFFTEYYYDQNGFILLGRQSKTFYTTPNSSLVLGKTWFSGDSDGSIRIYSFEE